MPAFASFLPPSHSRVACCTQVHEVLMTRALATVAPGDASGSLPLLQAVLSCACLPPDLRSYTVAAGAAHVSSFGLDAF